MERSQDTSITRDAIVEDRPCPITGCTHYKRKALIKDFFYSKETFPLLENCESGLLITGNAPNATMIGDYYDSASYISHNDSHASLIDKIYQIARAVTLRWKRRIVRRHLSVPLSTSAVLDVGSGTGHFAHTLQKAGCRVKAVEQSADARKVAQMRFHIDAESSLTETILQANSLDMITLWHVLEHIDDLSAHFAEFRRLLKPNGKLLIAVPNPSGYDARHYGAFWAAYDVPRHLWHFTPESLEKLAEKEGFRRRVIKAMPLDAFYIALLSEKYCGKAPLRAFCRALAVGSIAFLRTLTDTREASSLISIFEKFDE